MKNKQYYIVGTAPKSNIKIVGRSAIHIPYTQIHDCSHSWLHTGNSRKIGCVKLV